MSKREARVCVPSSRALTTGEELPKRNLGALEVVLETGKTEDEAMAALVMGGTAANTVTSLLFAKSTFGELSLTESMKELRRQTEKVQGGDTAQLESMLFGQATALASIFHECIRRSAANMGEFPQVMERYMRLGLKAQSQCRTTLESLAEIKNPRSVAFVRQANIANGHQQVNNGNAPSDRAEVFGSEPNELQEPARVPILDS